MPYESWSKLDHEVIYFVGAERGPVKIGRSISLVRRIRELQVGHPGLLHVWAIVPGNNLDEAIYHHRFAKDRVWGEWFARSDDMQEFLDSRAVMRGDLRLPAPRQRDGLPQRNGGACDERL